MIEIIHLYDGFMTKELGKIVTLGRKEYPERKDITKKNE
jgi:hypothetical protein